MSVSHEDINRAIGRVEGNQDGFRERMDRFERLLDEGLSKVEDALEKIAKRLDALEARETERKGAWKVIVAVAGGVSAVVAGLAKYITS